MIAFRSRIIFILPVLVLISCNAEEPAGPQQTFKKKVLLTPPFWGTIFLDPDIVTPSDSSTFQSITYSGQGERTMYDRRVNDWITNNAFLFDVVFNDSLYTEIQVNSEFESSDIAFEFALFYAKAIGQLPTGLRKDLQTVWIHKGIEVFGGGNNNILIHTGQGQLYINDGILEEALIHEGSHTSLDAFHALSRGWKDAQKSDPSFISQYAMDNPDREDIAETYLVYFALRYRPDRISSGLADTIMQTVPNRIEYFDNQNINMYPVE